MVLKQDVSRAESCLVVHLFEAAMNLVPCIGVVSGWCCKEVYRYPHNNY